MSVVIAPRAVALDVSLLAAVTRICLQCGENVVSGIICALLGVSAMARVSLKLLFDLALRFCKRLDKEVRFSCARQKLSSLTI